MMIVAIVVIRIILIVHIYVDIGDKEFSCSRDSPSLSFWSSIGPYGRLLSDKEGNTGTNVYNGALHSSWATYFHLLMLMTVGMIHILIGGQRLF